MRVNASRAGYYMKARITAKVRYLQIFENGEFTEVCRPLPGFDPWITVYQDGNLLYSFRPTVAKEMIEVLSEALRGI